MEPTEKRPAPPADNMVSMLGILLDDPSTLALAVAFNFGQAAGDHHKAWVIDQMVRSLLGDDYPHFVEAYENGGEYEWETGVAP